MVIPKINSAHGSDTRNIINRAIDLINVQGRSIQDLVAEGQLTPTQYAQLIAVVNSNVKKGSITSADIDKNNFKLDQTYMSDSLLQMMAGNTPINAVPANNSLTTEKFVNASVNTDKTTNLTTEGVVLGDTGHIIFDYSAETLTITSARLISKDRSYGIYNKTLDFSDLGNATYILYYLPSSEEIKATTTSNLFIGLPQEAIKFGYFSPSRKRVYGIDFYTSDGKAYYPQSEFSYKPSDYHGFHVGQPDRFNFNIDYVGGTSKIEIKPYAGRILYRDHSFALSEQEIDISHISYGKLVYNTLNNLVEVYNYTDFTPETGIVFAAYHLASSSIYNMEHCYVNGKPKNVTNASLEWDPTDDLYVVDGDLSGIYNAPTLESKDINSGDYLYDKTSSEMYAHYDDLVSRFPEYVSKELLGNEPTGLPIYRYDFKPKKPTSTLEVRTPKIIITSGIHGSERAAGWITYETMKQLCENWKSDSILETLRWNVHIVVIALVNPWGWDNGGDRRNSNEVDLNRNFPTFWSGALSPGDSEYGGTEPLSEIESQLVMDVLENETDVIYVCDFHNFNISSDNYMIWNAAATKFNQNISSHLVSNMSRKWKSEQEYLPQNDDFFLGHVSGGIGGTIAIHAARELQLQASVFEISQGFQLEQGTSLAFSSLTLTMGLEAFVNWLAMVVRNNVHLINTQSTKKTF